MKTPIQIVRNGQRGSTAVEFALLMPVLLLLTFAIFDLSWYFASAQGVKGVVREAARVGSQATQDEDAAAIALAHATAEMANTYPANLMNVTYEVSVVAGDQLQVSATLAFQPLVGLAPSPATFFSSSVRFLEDPPVI